MKSQSSSIRRVTVSLPGDLVDYADRQAAQNQSSRSQVISQALACLKSLEEEALAAEGYQFYGQEAEDFAAVR